MTYNKANKNLLNKYNKYNKFNKYNNQINQINYLNEVFLNIKKLIYKKTMIYVFFNNYSKTEI